MTPARWSVVVPTLNEEAALPACAAAVRAGGPCELIVSDGGSRDGTVALARKLADRVLDGPPGRGAQLHRGAQAASGSRLLFLHADALLPPGWQDALDRALEAPRPPAAAAFRIRYDAEGFGFRLIEAAVHLRARLSGLAYGDHGLALTRAAYDRSGGYPELPLMEDIALCRRLKGVALLPEALRLSARRQGPRPLRNALRNQLYVLLYLGGLSPATLYRLYYGGADAR